VNAVVHVVELLGGKYLAFDERAGGGWRVHYLGLFTFNEPLVDLSSGEAKRPC
jgi:hypothetical protein